MITNTVVRARIDEHIKEEAAVVLATFKPRIPNRETIKAMRAARRGNLVTVGGIDKLLDSLNADD